jgi:predicted nucleic acid-binding protein
MTLNAAAATGAPRFALRARTPQRVGLGSPSRAGELKQYRRRRGAEYDGEFASTNQRRERPSVAAAGLSAGHRRKSGCIACEDELESHFAELVERGSVMGPLVHDARVAALCAAHGVAELWSADRDFSRFPGLTVRNPLL